MGLNLTGESAPVQWGVLPTVPRDWLEIFLVLVLVLENAKNSDHTEWFNRREQRSQRSCCSGYGGRYAKGMQRRDNIIYDHGLYCRDSFEFGPRGVPPSEIRVYSCSSVVKNKRALARLFSRNGTRQHTQKRWPTPKPGGK